MKLLNIIKNIVLDIVIILLLLFIIVGFFNKNKPTSIFGYYLFTVKTGSMQPELKVGDNIIVKKSNSYSIGDIITYKDNDIYVTHRIVNIEGNQIFTKGDANNLVDPAFDKSLILGKVIYKSNMLNFLLKNKIIIILFIIIIYLISLLFKKERKVTKIET